MAGVSSQYAAKSDAVDGLASLNAKLAADMNDLIRTLVRIVLERTTRVPEGEPHTSSGSFDADD